MYGMVGSARLFLEHDGHRVMKHYLTTNIRGSALTLALSQKERGLFCGAPFILSSVLFFLALVLVGGVVEQVG
jgi:hypothetical protein